MPPAPMEAQLCASACQLASTWRPDKRRTAAAAAAGDDPAAPSRCCRASRFAPSAASRRAAAASSLVGRPLALGAIHADRHGVTARQLQRDDGARVAHHGAAHQLAQALGIGRLARLARRHMGGAKLLQCLEDAGLEQRQQVVELGEIVLHRRRRQQQQEALVERVHQLVALARAVAQMVGFVHDDEIEAAAENVRRHARCDAPGRAKRSGASASRTVPGRCAAARHGWSRRQCRTWSRAPPATARPATPESAPARCRPCRAADTP